jgi:hypothetical protein
MPRKSAAALTVVAGTIDGRPQQPPSDLTEFQPGFPICRLLNDDHAAVRRIQQASGGPGHAARLPTAAF